MVSWSSFLICCRTVFTLGLLLIENGLLYMTRDHEKGIMPSGTSANLYVSLVMQMAFRIKITYNYQIVNSHVEL